MIISTRNTGRTAVQRKGYTLFIHCQLSLRILGFSQNFCPNQQNCCAFKMKFSIQRISITPLNRSDAPSYMKQCSKPDRGLQCHFSHCKGSKKGTTTTEPIISKHISSALFGGLASWTFFNLASHFNMLVLRKRALK